MNKILVPLAALALAGLTGCSGQEAANGIDENSTIETNLGAIDEPLANDAALGNEILLSNDSAGSSESENATIVDPTLNGAGNSTAR